MRFSGEEASDVSEHLTVCRDPKAKDAGLSRRFVKVEGPLDLWIYLGSSGDYIVVPGLYCSCPKFQRGARTGSSYCCHHVKGIEYAIEAGRYHVVKGVDQVSVIREVLIHKIAYTVRRALFAGHWRGG